MKCFVVVNSKCLCHFKHKLLTTFYFIKIFLTAKKKQPIRRAAKLIDPLPNKPVVKQKILKPNPEPSTTKTTLPVVVGPNKLEDHDYCVVFQPNDESASSMSDDKDLPAGLIRVKRLPNIKSAPTTPS